MQPNCHLENKVNDSQLLIKALVLTDEKNAEDFLNLKRLRMDSKKIWLYPTILKKGFYFLNISNIFVL